MSSNAKTFLFAFVTCVISSLVLTFTATSLKPIQEKNIQLDRQKNILLATGILKKRKCKNTEVEHLYRNQIKDMYVTPTGELSETDGEGFLPIHVNMKNGIIRSYAIPTSGPGLWSTLYGYIAIKGDGETISGFRIYKHAETPGLGGEAEKPWFLNQFIGKKIVNDRGEFISVGVVKGKAENTVPRDQLVYYVDGISGATITAKGVNDFLYNDLKKYEPFSSKLRGRP